MKANQFRIGNIIQGGTILELTSSQAVVSGGNISGSHGESYDEIVPIPLTQEWLERCGFDGSVGGAFMIMEIANTASSPTSLQFAGIGGYDSLQICRSKINALTVSCKFVHQLQNLYFALTNTELTVK